MRLLSHGPEPCVSANSTISAYNNIKLTCAFWIVIMVTLNLLQIKKIGQGNNKNFKKFKKLRNFICFLLTLFKINVIIFQHVGFDMLCAGVVQWQNSSLPSWPRGSDSHHPLQKFNIFDKKVGLCACSSAGQSIALLRRGSGVRIPSGTPKLWWVQLSWLERQIVALEVVGSTPTTHPKTC